MGSFQNAEASEALAISGFSRLFFQLFMILAQRFPLFFAFSLPKLISAIAASANGDPFTLSLRAGRLVLNRKSSRTLTLSTFAGYVRNIRGDGIDRKDKIGDAKPICVIIFQEAHGALCVVRYTCRLSAAVSSIGNEMVVFLKPLFQSSGLRPGIHSEAGS